MGDNPNPLRYDIMDTVSEKNIVKINVCARARMCAHVCVCVDMCVWGTYLQTVCLPWLLLSGGSMTGGAGLGAFSKLAYRPWVHGGSGVADGGVGDGLVDSQRSVPPDTPAPDTGERSLA